MKKVLSAVFVFILLCLIVAYGTLRKFNEKISSLIVAQLSEKTGRAVSIDGKTKISFSLSPSVRISDIKVKNASWATTPEMLQIGELEMQVDFLPLFNRKVDLKKINLKDVSVDLEEYSDGQKSWTISPVQEQKTSDVVDEKSFHISADQITAENVQFVYYNFSEPRIYKTQFDAMALKSSPDRAEISSKWINDDRTFDIKLSAKSNGGNNSYGFLFNADGEGVSLSAEGDVFNLLSDPRVKSVVKLHVDQADILNKKFNLSLPEFSDVNVTVHVSYDFGIFSVRDFSIRAGTKETAFVSADGSVLSLSPFEFMAHTEISALNMGEIKGLPSLPVTETVADIEWSKDIVLRNFKMSAGDSNLFGDIEIRKDPSLFVVVHLKSEKFSLTDFLGRISLPVKKKEKKTTSYHEKVKLFSPEPLPYESLKNAEIDIAIDLANVTGMDGTAFGSFSPSVKMKNGVFELSGFKLADYAELKGRFDASKQPAKLSADMTMKDFPLPAFLLQKKVERGTLNGSIHFTGSGNSEAEIASSVGGHFFAEAKDAYISSYRLLSLPKQISSALKVQENMPVSISCAVVNVPAKNGYFSLQNAIGVESSLANLQGKGDIDLSREKIRLDLEAEMKKEGLFKALVDSISIRGDIDDPRIDLNLVKSVNKILKIGLAYLTGGEKAAKEQSGNPPLRDACATARAKEQKVFIGEKK